MGSKSAKDGQIELQFPQVGVLAAPRRHAGNIKNVQQGLGGIGRHHVVPPAVGERNVTRVRVRAYRPDILPRLGRAHIALRGWALLVCPLWIRLKGSRAP